MSDLNAGHAAATEGATLETSVVFDLPLARLGLEQAVKYLARRIQSNACSSYIVVTPNVSQVVALDGNLELKRRYEAADMFLADGTPLVWTTRVLAKALPERVTGSDLMPALLKSMLPSTPVAVVGGFPEHRDSDEALLSRAYPQCRFRVFAPPLGFDPQSGFAGWLATEVASFEPKMVFVCLGFPKQEIWALHHRKQLEGAVVLCCGASLDFMSGRVRRAPSMLRQLGLEWLWRLASEPRRLWRRYLFDGLSFGRLLVREWLSARQY